MMRYRRPPILDELPEGRFAAIEASAGTGKTFTLEHLVIDRLIAGASIEDVLVVTFTEKATREMKRRVRETLGRIVHPHVSDLALNPTEGPVWTIDDATRTRLMAAWMAFERAPISTIHGFCQRVLSDHAFRSRRPFKRELVEPRRAFGVAFRDELRALLGGPSTDRRVMLRVLDQFDANRLEGLLYRWHSERGRVLPAWNEERFVDALIQVGDERLTDMIRAGVPRADVALRLVKQVEALQAIAARHQQNRDPLAALIAVDKWGQTEVVQNEPARTWVPARLTQVEGARERIEGLLHGAPSLFGVLVHRLLPRVRRRLDAQKARRFQIDFDDMLGQLAEALHDDAGGPLVDALRRQYPHALVDEFQDTDDIQWSIFRKLYVDEGSTGTLTIIGDPKQAIYGFRNADVHTYYEARECLVGKNVVHLKDCYRATRRLIEGYNPIFEPDPGSESSFFQGTVGYDHPVSAGDRTRRLLGPSSARQTSDGLDELGASVGAEESEEVSPREKDAAAIVLWQIAGTEKPNAATMRSGLGARIAIEARAIVGGSVRLHESGTTRNLMYSDMQVLVRNAREADAIAEALRLAGVPHALFKQEGLFETDQAQALLDVFRAVDEPGDRGARLRAWMTDFFDVPLEKLDACREIDPRDPLVTKLHGWHHAAERRQPGLLRTILVESGLVRRLLFRRGGSRALTNYEHIVEILSEEQGSSARLRETIALLEAFVDGRAEPVMGGSAQRQGGERDAVQLLTMHKSKGLEAPIVFVAGGFTRSRGGGAQEPHIAYAEREGKRVREAWLPPMPAEVQRRVDQETREADERLFYVAITRAKGRVYLPYFGPPPAHHHTKLAGRQVYGPVQGAYRWVNARLTDLVVSGYVDDDRVCYEVVPAELEAPQETVAPKAMAPLEPCEAPDFDALRQEHQGFTITSYTRIKATANAAYKPTTAGATMDDEKSEEFSGEVVEVVEAVEAVEASETGEQGPAVEIDGGEESPLELPGGASVGIFLHEILEHVQFDSLEVLPGESEPDKRAAWIAKRQESIEAAARRQGVDPEWADTAATLIWRALRTPQRLGELKLEQGLSVIRNAVAEMEVFYPIPEIDHPPLGVMGHHHIQRGVIRGIIDLVFELDGRTYFLDWKSDRVPPDQKLLRTHVDDNYALQARLYTLGIVRMLGVSEEADYEARFGGLVYVFLRVMAPGQGLVFDRPSWSEVCAWDEELRTADRPFGYVIE